MPLNIWAWIYKTNTPWCEKQPSPTLAPIQAKYTNTAKLRKRIEGLKKEDGFHIPGCAIEVGYKNEGFNAAIDKILEMIDE